MDKTKLFFQSQIDNFLKGTGKKIESLQIKKMNVRKRNKFYVSILKRKETRISDLVFFYNKNIKEKRERIKLVSAREH